MLTHKRFLPPVKREALEYYYNNAKDGVICVSSMQENNDIEYRFKGVEDFDEFVNAVTYVMAKDMRSGCMSYAAGRYYSVYIHAQKDYVKRYLERRLGGVSRC